MPSLRRPALLLAMALLAALTAGCAGGDPASGSGSPSSPASAPASPPASASSAASSPSSSPTLAGSGVPVEAKAGYERALSVMGPAFTRFGRKYARAVAAEDTAGVMASARRLRAAVVDFDSAVRALDLGAEQRLVDPLLMLNGEFITTLDDVVGAASGTEAVRIVEGLPFQDFSLAFTELRDAL